MALRGRGNRPRPGGARPGRGCRRPRADGDGRPGPAVRRVVDYAHTAASLGKVLRVLRPLATGRVIAVFGSAGERDPTKRPAIGRVAADFSLDGSAYEIDLTDANAAALRESPGSPTCRRLARSPPREAHRVSRPAVVAAPVSRTTARPRLGEGQRLPGLGTGPGSGIRHRRVRRRTLNLAPRRSAGHD